MLDYQLQTEAATQCNHQTFQAICLTAHIKLVHADRPSVQPY